jgi:predicted ATP-binding protein involved in virulence
MSPSLSSVSISNFRSINGTITVPLNAPVILVHGPNGAGKTSVLSANELALTGEIVAMQRTDANYRSHLIHRVQIIVGLFSMAPALRPPHRYHIRTSSNPTVSAAAHCCPVMWDGSSVNAAIWLRPPLAGYSKYIRTPIRAKNRH